MRTLLPEATEMPTEYLFTDTIRTTLVLHPEHLKEWVLAREKVFGDLHITRRMKEGLHHTITITNKYIVDVRWDIIARAHEMLIEKTVGKTFDTYEYTLV